MNRISEIQKSIREIREMKTTLMMTAGYVLINTEADYLLDLISRMRPYLVHAHEMNVSPIEPGCCSDELKALLDESEVSGE